jgi:hypothetical protein
LPDLVKETSPSVSVEISAVFLLMSPESSSIFDSSGTGVVLILFGVFKRASSFDFLFFAESRADLSQVHIGLTPLLKNK